MPGPQYHARTHLPGGTDPIQFPSPASAIASGGKSMTLTGDDLVNLNTLYATPSYYEAEGGDPTDFEFVNLLQDGFYQADFVVNWGVAFSGSDFPFIEPACQIAGIPDTLINSVTAYFDNTANWIGGEQKVTSEYAHLQLYARVLFNYTAADVDPDFGIGIRLSSSSTATKTISGALAVTRLGDALEVVA